MAPAVAGVTLVHRVTLVPWMHRVSGVTLVSRMSRMALVARMAAVGAVCLRTGHLDGWPGQAVGRGSSGCGSGSPMVPSRGEAPSVGALPLLHFVLPGKRGAAFMSTAAVITMWLYYTCRRHVLDLNIIDKVLSCKGIMDNFNVQPNQRNSNHNVEGGDTP